MLSLDIIHKKKIYDDDGNNENDNNDYNLPNIVNFITLTMHSLHMPQYVVVSW